MIKDVICFCHIRWDFVYQRPQHLLTRLAKDKRVFIIEDPVFDAVIEYNEISFNEKDGLWIVVPHIPSNIPQEKISEIQKSLLDLLIMTKKIRSFMLWYYNPMALKFSTHLSPAITVYDCMDELSNFKFAPPDLKLNESMLFERADIVFTGGNHLFEAKKSFHVNIHSFPSSIDKEHFKKARSINNDPKDQKTIGFPRIGFYGVVDERFDIDLLGKVAEKKPEWQFIIIGPIVKIDPVTLPKNLNIHYLGGKQYNELPSYLSGWNIAMLPFAINESTKYISPTKTPEYLAGGKPVISTPIKDVVFPYGEKELVEIICDADEFMEAGEKILMDENKEQWLLNVDDFLKDNSWDNTWEKMNDLITTTLNKNNIINNKNTRSYV